MQGAGIFFDGETAGRHEVRVGLSQDRLALVIEGDTIGAPRRWPLTDLRAISDPAQHRELVLTRHAETEDETPRDPARLVLRDPVLVDWLLKTRPALHRRDLHRGTGLRILRNATLAVGAVVAMIFIILPAMANTLARIIPLDTEIRFGQAVTAQMERFLGGSELGALHCADPAGRAALDRMVARLTAGRDLGYDLTLTVFDHEMVNAFAAPGGQVVVLRGLLDKASGPDAVAAVLAHEIGHVVHRDATRNALRAAGSAGLLSLVIGDVVGGAVLVAVADTMLSSAYSRAAEEAADTFALEMMTDAGLSTEGFAAFFDQLKKIEGGLALPEYLASHPTSAGRAARARAHAATQQGTTPVLSGADWDALRKICD